MTFTPLTMDGREAAARMLSWGSYTQHRCLEAVHRAFPFERSDAPGSYREAVDEWKRVPPSRRHPSDRNPPAGAIVLWELDVFGLGSPGHIAISLGGGNVVSTDWPSRGRIGIASIAAINANWGARYLGWTDVIGGHNVVTAATPPDLLRKDAPMLIAIDGKKNSRRGGTYYVADGKASLIAPYQVEGVPYLTDDAAIAALQERIPTLR